MDTEKAIKMLNLSSPFTETELKRNYHKLSLKLHPDKNNSPNATAEFQELNDAYKYLKENIISDMNVEANESYDIFEMLNNFTSKISGKKIDKSIILNIIEKLTNKREKLYTELFEGVDRQTSFELFKYFKKYAEIFNISNDTLDVLINIINEKYKNDEIIKLHPTIDNLMNDDLYKLEINDNIYYIPLWHHEMTYDLSNNVQLIINVIPELDNHISIDDYNNLHIHLTKSIEGLLTLNVLSFNIGEKVFNIPCENLYIKKRQRYICKKKGISKIDTTDVYNVSKRGDIIVHLTLLDCIH